MPQQNLKVSSEYIEFLLSSNRAVMGHLYQFTSANGANDYFTDLDTDIIYGGVTWKSGSLRVNGLQRKVSVGLQVDEQTIKIFASPTDTLFGAVFLENAEQGLLDGALIVRYRAIWQLATGNAAYDLTTTQPIAVWPMFTGYTSSIDKGGATHIELKVKSPLVKLEVNMPRNYWQPGCNWTLFDQGCTLLKSSYAVTGTVGTGPTPTTIPISGGIANVTGADGFANYSKGRLLFTSGVNNGLQVLLGSNDSVNLYLAYPLVELPSAGDTVLYYPGCSKAYNTCNLKFGNAVNFRGFDKVPPVVVSM